MNSILVAVVYAAVAVAIIPLVFALFRTQYQFLDVVLASVAAAAASFIPTIGGPASLVVMVAVLYWRIGQGIFPDIVVAVGAARLAMVPVLLALQAPH